MTREIKIYVYDLIFVNEELHEDFVANTNFENLYVFWNTKCIVASVSGIIQHI